MTVEKDYENLDNVIGSLNGGELVTIASRPRMGKSSLLIDIINNVSKQTNDKILYFNLETSKEILKTKIISDNVEIIDTPAITIEEIKNKCEEVSKSGLSLVAIDYVQLVSTSSINNEKQFDYISRALKTMAMELDISVIALSQLGRQVEERENKRPVLRDLDVTGSIVQDSDKVIFLYRENYYNKEYELNDMELIIAKNRGGSTDIIKMLFDEI